MSMLLPRMPGVKIDATVVPRVPGPLATGVPAFLGAVAGSPAPTNRPLLVTQWSGFANTMGNQDAWTGALAPAVHGFFDNGGSSCYVVLLDEAFDPVASLAAGLDALETQDAVDLIAAPDVSMGDNVALVRTLQTALLTHCGLRNDRFTLLDASPHGNVADVLAQRQGLSGLNGALYYPWVLVDPRDGLAAGPVPPCGHVAGLVARADAAYGVQKAPANDVVAGVFDLEKILSDDDHAGLNEAGVNTIRAFPGRGIRVMGARTLSSDPAWTFVNTRRIFLTVCRWVTVNLAPLAFEPNDTRLWARVGRELTAYCDDLFRRGALQGRTAREAYFVKCDAETNPPEVRESGLVVTEMGIAPVVPNEFVIVRIVQGDGGVTLAVPGQTA